MRDQPGMHPGGAQIGDGEGLQPLGRIVDHFHGHVDGDAVSDGEFVLDEIREGGVRRPDLMCQRLLERFVLMRERGPGAADDDSFSFCFGEADHVRAVLGVRLDVLEQKVLIRHLELDGGADGERHSITPRRAVIASSSSGWPGTRPRLCNASCRGIGSVSRSRSAKSVR